MKYRLQETGEGLDNTNYRNESIVAGMTQYVCTVFLNTSC